MSLRAARADVEGTQVDHELSSRFRILTRTLALTLVMGFEQALDLTT